MKRLFFYVCLTSILIVGCNQKDHKTTAASNEKPKSTIEQEPAKAPAAKQIADAATILARPEVPVLCYHQIRNWTGGDSRSAKEIIVPTNLFKAQLKLLADSGYHTILPDQLYDYLAYGTPLPDKPFMLTYDDTDDDQYDIAWQEMKKYGFKGVFFIMTVSINRPKYMKREHLKELSDAGNVIASHTWNHMNFTRFKTEEDWLTQIEKPKKQIVDITGKPAEYFAYPYGVWNKEGIPELRRRGIKAAFILATQRDPYEPLYTIRRMIASGFWSAPGLYYSMLKTFHLNK